MEAFEPEGEDEAEEARGGRQERERARVSLCLFTRLQSAILLAQR